MHSFAPGVQTPVQLPALQTYVHGLPSTHVPLALHVSGVFPVQLSVNGTHSPEQTPALQT